MALALSKSRLRFWTTALASARDAGVSGIEGWLGMGMEIVPRVTFYT